MNYSSAAFSIVIIVSCTFFGTWAGTQWIAAKLHYPIEFGMPVYISDSGVGWYFPFSIVIWYTKYYDYASKFFDKAALFVYSGVLSGFIYVVAAAMYRDRKKNQLTSHGTARWAVDEDIAKSGLLENKGVVLGMVQSKGKKSYLRSNGPEHIMVFAPTGAGKGINTIITTLLTWFESLFVLDIKGENFGITSKFRKEILGQYVMKFEPANPDGTSVKYNPLAEIRYKTEYELGDTQTIAKMLADPDGDKSGTSDDYWATTGAAFLVGVILHLLYKGKGIATLTEAATFISDLNNCLQEMMETTHDSHEFFLSIYDETNNVSESSMEKILNGVHPKVLEAAVVMANKPDKERGSVASYATKCLELYRDPIVAKNTAYSEFKMKDLMGMKKAVSLYLIIQPKDIPRIKPLARLMITQMLASLTETMDYDDAGDLVKGYKHRLLLLLDEFPALGKIELFESAIAYIRGYGMKAMVIIQDVKQMNKYYTHDNSIFSNCNIRLAYPPNDEKTADLLSKLLGKQTIEVEQKSFSGSRFNAFLGNQNISVQEISRDLLTADELLTLSEDKIIVFKRGCQPILGDRIEYYNDENFIRRKMGPCEQSDRIRKNVDEKIISAKKQEEFQKHIVQMQENVKVFEGAFARGLDIIEQAKDQDYLDKAIGIDEDQEF